MTLLRPMDRAGDRIPRLGCVHCSPEFGREALCRVPICGRDQGRGGTRPYLVEAAGRLLAGGVLFLALVFLALCGQAATFTVSNTSDSGSGSLRQAMLDANTNAGPDAIVFQIPGSGTHSIQPLSALPAITDPVSIDGTTQPGFSSSPLVEINGASAGNNAGLRLLAGNTTIRS